MDDGTRQAIDQLVRARRSIRRFTDRSVSKQLLMEIFDIAGSAPSNSNMQPWRVYLVGGVAKDKLAQALSQAHQKSPADYQPERPMYATKSARPVFRSAAAIWARILRRTRHRPGRYGGARPADSPQPHFL